MPVYEGSVKLKNNSVKRVALQARTAQEAERHMGKMGRIITVKKKAGFDINAGLTLADRQIFFSRLSSMLSSRVGTSAALALLRDTFKGRIQEVAARLLAQVEAGKDLSDAMETIGAPDFPEATVALIKAGARSGETWRALQDAAQFERELALVKKGAAKGLAMGVFSFIFAGVITVGSTLYVGPKIMESDLIKAAGDAVNIDFINTTAYAVGYMMAFLLVIGMFFFLLAAVGRSVNPVMADKLILKIPYYKDLVLAKNNFIVLYGLSLLVKSGVRTEEALRLSAQGAPRGALRTDLVSATTAVKTGKHWPQAMTTFHPTDKASLMSASDREQVAGTLHTLATQYRELYAQRLGSFVPMLNLVSALFMCIAGGILFGQAILPMLMASGGVFG